MLDEPVVESPREAPRKGVVKKIVQFLFVTHPPAIYFLLINSILYKMAQNGGKSIDYVYLKEELKYSPYQTKLLYHVAKFTAFPFAVLGAWLADRYLGKFFLCVPKDWLWIMVYSSYFFASLLLSVEIQVYVAITGLFLGRLAFIGVSSIVAFPGDQYADDKTADRDNFFFAFYFCINVGSLLGSLLIPRFRTIIHCFENNENCYPAAFGLVVCTSLLSTITLFSGYRFYKFLRPEKETYGDILKCFFVALSRRIALFFKGVRSCSVKEGMHNRSHWIDLADDKYNEQIIYDVKCFLGAAMICTSYPMFWALFEQQSTLWTLMSDKLDGRTIFGQISPDEMESWNPFMVMVCIVILACIVYPLCAKCKFLTTPLERIGYGFVFAAISYIVGGFVFIHIENELPAYPDTGMTEVTFYNGLPCDVNLKMILGKNITLPKYTSDQLTKIFVDRDLSGVLTIEEEKCIVNNISRFHFEVDADGGFAYSVLFTVEKNGTNITYQQARQNRTRENKGSSPKLRFVYIGPGVNGRLLHMSSASGISCTHLPEQLLECSGDDCPEYFIKANSMNYVSKLCYSTTTLQDKEDEMDCTCDEEIGEYAFLRGGIYDVIVIEGDNGTHFSVVETSAPDSVPILLQLPMFVFLTLGEVMCSTTGYAFVYSESPGSTKCLLQVLFYVAQAFGNLYVVVIDMIILAVYNSVAIPDYLRPQESPRYIGKFSQEPNSDTTYIEQLNAVYVLGIQGSQIFFAYSLLATVNLVYFIMLSKRYHYANPDYRALK